MELTAQPAQKIQAAMRKLHWGAAWLEVMLRRADAAKSAEAYDRLRQVLDMVATAVEYREFRPAALAFVTRLAPVLECARVSLGFRKRKRARISALSHSAEFGKNMNVVRAIESAVRDITAQHRFRADGHTLVVAGEPLDEPTHRWIAEALRKPVIDSASSR